MILHEVNHAIDDRIFTTPELKKQYADNVHKHIEKQGGVLKVYSDNIIKALEDKYNAQVSEARPNLFGRLSRRSTASQNRVRHRKRRSTVQLRYLR